MKKEAVYFLIRDLLDNFSADTESSLIGALNRYAISKEATRLVFRDEVKQKKPNYSILRGILMVLSNLLRQFPQSGFYEVLEVIDELRYCFKKDPRKTIKKLSGQVTLRLFANLYFEFRMLPMHHKEDEEYIQKFKKYFSRNDLVKIINSDIFLTRFIFQRHYIDIGFGEERNRKLIKIINEFYEKS